MNLRNLLLFVFFSTIFYGCKKNNNTPAPPTGSYAKGLFINATLNEDSLRVNINDTFQSSVGNLLFLSNGGYKNIRTGKITIGFFVPKTNGVVATTVQTTQLNEYYSVFAVGEGTVTNPPSILFVADDLSTPATGYSKIRFANLSVEPGFSMTAVIDNTSGIQKLDSNLSYKFITNFKTVTSGTYNITMGDPGSLKSVTLASQSLLSGKIYTYVFTGKNGATGNAAFALKLIENK